MAIDFEATRMKEASATGSTNCSIPLRAYALVIANSTRRAPEQQSRIRVELVSMQREVG